MSTRHALKKFVCALCAMTFFSLQAAQVQAAMVSTESLLQQTELVQKRTAMFDLLQQTEVRQQLEAYGVDPVAAQARVQRMTVAELDQLHGQIETLPAGGDALGTIAVIFVILLITDIAGLTNIFPFVRK